MDPSPVHTTPSLNEDEDEWGNCCKEEHGDYAPCSVCFEFYDCLLKIFHTDGFVIPSLGIEDSNTNKADASEVEALKPPSPKTKKEENIYLGPHGAPPSQSRQQELNFTSRKQRFKQKLKEADRRISGTGRENKVENLRELVGGGRVSANMQKDSPRDWLDPHCNESQFEKWYNPQ